MTLSAWVGLAVIAVMVVSFFGLLWLTLRAKHGKDD